MSGWATTTTTTTTKGGVTTTTTVTQTGVAVAFGGSSDSGGSEAADVPPLPRSKDDITAEWLTKAMRSHGSLPSGVEVTGLEVSYLKGEDNKAAGGVAQLMAGGFVLKLVPTYSSGADLPRTIVAKVTMRPDGALTVMRADGTLGSPLGNEWADDEADAQEAWAYSSGTFAKMPGACECFFAKQDRKSVV